MTPDLRIVIPGDPGAARINGARRASIKQTATGPKPTTHKSAKLRRWEASAKVIVRAAWRDAGQRAPLVGAVTLEVRAYWPRLRRVGPAMGQPLGDVDAVVKPVLDVLAAAGVFGNDGQVRVAVLANEYDRDRPRIEVCLGRQCELERLRSGNANMLEAIDHLVGVSGVPRSACPNASLADWLEAVESHRGLLARRLGAARRAAARSGRDGASVSVEAMREGGAP